MASCNGRDGADDHMANERFSLKASKVRRKARSPHIAIKITIGETYLNKRVASCTLSSLCTKPLPEGSLRRSSNRSHATSASSACPREFNASTLPPTASSSVNAWLLDFSLAKAVALEMGLCACRDWRVIGSTSNKKEGATCVEGPYCIHQ